MTTYLQEERDWFMRSLREGPLSGRDTGSSLLTMLATEKLKLLRRQHSRPLGRKQFRFLPQKESTFDVAIDGFPVFAVEFSFHTEPICSATHIKGEVVDGNENNQSFKRPCFRFAFLKEL